MPSVSERNGERKTPSNEATFTREGEKDSLQETTKEEEGGQETARRYLGKTLSLLLTRPFSFSLSLLRGAGEHRVAKGKAVFFHPSAARDGNGLFSRCVRHHFE